MAVLLRCELKKLLSRRMVLVFVALCVAYNLYANWSLLLMNWSGLVQGMEDVYAQYEGRVVTEDLQAEVREAAERYSAEHPGLIYKQEDPDGSVYYSTATAQYSYPEGMCWAYGEILNRPTLEDRQKRFWAAEQVLSLGKNEDGSPLTENQRQSLERTVRYGVVKPAIHFAKGWETGMLNETQFSGPMMLLLLILGLLPLFAGERAARMEGILLCSAGRARAALAKMLAASAFAGALVLLFMGTEFMIVACTYGFDGALLPVLETGGISNLGAFALALLSVMLAGAACASLVALASALSRHTLAALLLAGVFIAVQFLPQTLIDQCVTNWLIGSIADPALPPPWCYPLQEYTRLLPSTIMTVHFFMAHIMANTKWAAFAFGFSALSAALLYWLVPRCYFRKRKA